MMNCFINRIASKRGLHVVSDQRLNLSKNKAFVKYAVKNGRFISPWDKAIEKGWLDYLWSQLQRRTNTFFDGEKILNDSVASTRLITTKAIDKEKMFSRGRGHVTWIGHATCYVQVEGLFFLTDPVWSYRASPSQFFGPARYIDPPVEIEDIPVDVVLLSHTHYDHMDIATVQRIGNRALWVVPLGVKQLLSTLGVTNSVELDWWSSISIRSASKSLMASDVEDGEGVDVVLTPARHWTARTLLDRNKCLWGSFAVLSRSPSGPRIYFAGDTAYCPELFKTIGAHFGPFDMSLIPIGAYRPRAILEGVHCCPNEAVHMHLDLRSKQSMGMHWGTFRLADEEDTEPALELGLARSAMGVQVAEFFTMGHGETLLFGDAPQHDFCSVFSEEAALFKSRLQPSDQVIA